MYRNMPKPIGGRSQDYRMRNRLKNILIILLIAACVYLFFSGQNDSGYHSKAWQTYRDRALAECRSAITLCNNLSRTGGSGTAETLGGIRSRIYAINTINGISAELGGSRERLVDISWFTQINGLLDTYYYQLQTGALNTSNLQNDLYAALNELLQQLDALI